MNQQPLVYHLTNEHIPALSEVGGKGRSLIHMHQAGFSVPPGFVLTAAFFKPWFAQLTQSGLWTAVCDSSPTTRKTTCEEAKRETATYEFTAGQREVLTAALDALIAAGATLFAVRSSSPEEDLDGASFAGGYETTLGVTQAGLEEAIRRSFASCLDERVFVYKRQHGFDVTQPRIAVVIQEQIAADSAGVAFSLNPLNNCYDETVINANFGLGETVVSGAVSPDTFVVDRVKQVIVNREIGRKQTALFLGKDGGTVAEPVNAGDRPSLTNHQVLEIADLTSAVATHYGKPIDIEWAFAGDHLFLLQARPITAYYPLPAVMITPPGAPKRLYADKTLLKQGINAPLTVMGTDFLAYTDVALGDYVGGANADIINGLGRTFDGRMYLNVSNNMKLQGHKRLVTQYRAMDALASEVLANIDPQEYIPAKLPNQLKGMVWKAIGHNLKPLLKSIKAFRQPEQYKMDVAAAVHTLRQETLSQLNQNQPFRPTVETLLRIFLAYMDEAMASLAVSELSRLRLKRLFKKEPEATRQKVVYLERALPHNITIEMGLAMNNLAAFPEITACTSGDQFVQRLQAGDFSAEFMQTWHDFLDKYGFRCPLELDLGTRRYDEEPGALFTQLRILAENRDPAYTAAAIIARAQSERETVFAELYTLLQKRSPRKARTFRKLYRNLVAFGGMRESHKYHLIWMLNHLRKKILATAEELVKDGRLPNTQQVFDLTIDQLDQALDDPGLDLQLLAYENTAYLRRLAQVRDFPRIFDSRGKILRAPRRQSEDGELVGQPISPGVVQGKVKVLHAPDEKPVLPGEILVARATDPGWTPLFTNAAAIILEVGGILQHGSLVAREYGKPCVAGIENITELLQDGQLIEVDGLTGVVRQLAA